jgi:hypothetical protein
MIQLTLLQFLAQACLLDGIKRHMDDQTLTPARHSPDPAHAHLSLTDLA